MAHMSANVAETKPVESIQVEHLPDVKDPEDIVAALEELLKMSKDQVDVKNGMQIPMHMVCDVPLVHRLIPGLQELASKYHIGNFVIVRATGERVFESMPLFTRLGMHLLFYGGAPVKLLHNHTIAGILKDLSIRQGRVYDAPESVKSIPSFIETYAISLDDLERRDITQYTCFNDFFYRKLKSGARPVANAPDPTGICSAADCRLTVYPSVSAATQIWIKGAKFSIPALLGVKPRSRKARMFVGGSVAIFRLAPQDYHRFHSPIDGVVGEVVDIPGQYYTVNPQAVNEPGFDVLTDNRRCVLYMTHSQSGAPIAFIAIGAMLVGSILWTAGGQKGATVKRGEELGYFAYGGSTIVAVFPRSLIQFDDDLLMNSATPIETLVRVGDSLGRSVLPQAGFDAEEIMRTADVGPDFSARFAAGWTRFVDKLRMS
ncbi:phosphatidylserine decarboxylase-domain-containing protein [Daedaleopsis nitida]|nr:phosphatidylserine decarboxylase-domain-containing protein [Daedaleopsis nitida]